MPQQQQETTGFLDKIGIGSIDEETLLRQQAKRAGGGTAAGMERGIAGLLGRFATPGKSRQGGLDMLTAKQAGLTPDQLKARREIRTATASLGEGDGSIDAQISVAKQAARIANKYGAMDIVSSSLQLVTRLEKEKLEFAKLDGVVRAEKFEQDTLEETGRKARLNTDPKGEFGRTIRINEGPNIGLYTLIRPGQEDKIVRAGDLVFADEEAELASIRAKANKGTTLKDLVKFNTGTPGNLPKIRNNLLDMETTGIILTNIATNFLGSFDPQALLSATGKASITADKVISFAESVTTIMSNPKGGTPPVFWTDKDGRKKKVTTREQHDNFIDSAKNGGLLAYIKSVLGGQATLDDAVPESIRGNSLAAEQYWANVMELMYLDAKIQEPANRGLSDNDVENAGKRMSAHSANPISFATRQKEIIETKLLPRIQNLGSEFTTLQTDISQQDIIDEVFNPQVVDRVRSNLLSTLDLLNEVIEQGRRGESAAGSTEDAPTQSSREDEIRARIKELEAGTTPSEAQ